MPIRTRIIESTGIYRRTSTTAEESEWHVVFQHFSRRLDQDSQFHEVERLAMLALNGHTLASRDAQDVLDCLRFVRHWISQGDATSAAAEAIRLGSALERLYVRTFEPLIARGQRATRASIASAATKRRSTSARNARIRKRLADVHPMEAKSKTAAVYRVAREFGVKPRTVWRAL